MQFTKKTILMAAVASLSMGVAACDSGGEDATEAAAASTIAGTWESDPASYEFEGVTDRYTLIDGQYSCESCEPPHTIPADGEFHAVESDYYDEESMAVVDERTINGARRKDGEVVGDAVFTVSDDSQGLTIAWNNYGGDEATSGTIAFTRTADGPEGAHAISGAWAPSAMQDMSEAGRSATYTLEGDTIGASWNGGSYSAVLGGDPVKVEGDDGDGMLSVERTGENSFRETYLEDGEAVNTLDLTVDGDTLRYVSTDLRRNSTVRWTATRQ